MKIVIAGTGYVGLVTGACLAELGFSVVCADKDKSKIALLESGTVPFYEPGLAEIVGRNAGRRLIFSTNLAAEVPGADVVFIAVGTPTGENGEADMSAVYAVAREIAASLAGRTLIALKSTVPVGTARAIGDIVRGMAPRADFSVVSNPEFLREGQAVADFMRPDRVVVGVSEEAARATFERLYKPFADRDVPVLFMSNAAAELCKYAANTYLAMRIAYVNELADICEAVGADVGDVTAGMGFDKRIGRHYLAPGPGFGGSCFPKDTRALLATTRNAGVNFSLGEAIIFSNDRRKELLMSRVVGALGGSVKGRTVAILGLAFKADTDDVRDSAALPLIEALQGGGAAIRAFDPEAMQTAAESVRGVVWCKDAYEAATGADAAVLITEWEVFRRLDLKRLATLLRRPLLIDFRNLYKPASVAEAGLDYVSVGR
jgi:UDPglucose 6-dehydrogenase